jgi:hypothetical protein
MTEVNALSLVRFDTNDDSVPDRYAHRRVALRAGIDAIRIECDGQLIAEHLRDWGRHQTVFHGVHYLGSWSGSRGRWTSPVRSAA